jgi:hypothetical protein
MNLAETLQLLDKLKELGVTRFQDGAFEVTMSGIPAPMHIHMPPEAPVPIPEPAPLPPKPKTQAQAYNEENTKKMQALIDLLKMKDEELANTIFPDGA